MRKTKCLVLISVVLMLIIGSGVLPGCSCGSSDDEIVRTVVGNTGTIDTDKKQKVVTEKITDSGGVITVPALDTPLDGMEIKVSTGTYDGDTEFTVSYSPITDHSFGDAFNPVTPMINIDNDDVLADIPVELTVPLELPEGQFAMGFFYDEEFGTLEGLPLLSRDDDSITIATRHFSNIVISAVNTALLYADIDSGFRPGVDDWQFANRGSFLQPGGHCSGQASTAMWYYVTKPDGPDETLFNRYDNNGWEPASPAFWEDDSLGYRFASVVQLADDYDSRLFNLGYRISVLHEETWYLFAYSILVTGEPQFVAILNEAKSAGHALIAYRVSNGIIYVADPNYPGATDRVIKFENGRFLPYPSGANAELIAEGNGTLYDKIFYVAKTAWVDWESITERWKELKTLTIGDDVFPSYTIEWLDEQGTLHPLKDGLETSDSIIKLSMTSSIGAQSRFDVSRDGQSLSVLPVINSQAVGISLKPGTNRLGILVQGKIPDGRYKYIDFKYFNVIYTPETETPDEEDTSEEEQIYFKLAETKLSPLPEQPYTWDDAYGYHSATMSVSDNEIMWDVRTAGPGGTEAGASILKVNFTIPSEVLVGDEVEVVADWDMSVSGTKPRFTMGYIELYGGDSRYSELRRFTAEEEPTGSVSMEWKIKQYKGEFEVKAKVPFRGGYITIQWIYRPSEE